MLTCHFCASLLFLHSLHNCFHFILNLHLSQSVATRFLLEKEKIQRQFKLFREAKEVEVITILKEKQTLLNQLRRHIGNEGSIQDFLTESVDLRHAQSINEWLMDGHSGSDSYQQDEGGKWKQHSLMNDDHRARKGKARPTQQLFW